MLISTCGLKRTSKQKFLLSCEVKDNGTKQVSPGMITSPDNKLTGNANCLPGVKPKKETYNYGYTDREV